MKEVRTRFSPSPTGFMHIGNLRTAIFEYLLAKKNNGKFILRIEDTDQERLVEGSIDFIYKTLELCNFVIDEGPQNEGEVGPYIQSERKDIYKKYAQELVEKGYAYYCFCTEERLTKLREVASINKTPFMYDGHCNNLTKQEIEEKLKNNEPYVIRQKMPKEGQTVINDLVYGKVLIENSVLEDQILLKSDGYPTYNFANVVDDHLMKITHVIRGKEYLDQTAKYNLLYDAFGWEKPTYIHVAMVLGEDGNKLSKRNKDASFMDLYNEGYLPQAIVNYLVLLGWSPKDNQEIFTMDELIEAFDPTRISKSSSSYDVKKLRWFNAHYIKQLEKDEVVNLCLPFLQESYDLKDKTPTWIEHLIEIYQNHLSYGKEIVELTELFFKEDITLDEECQEFMQQETVDETINTLKPELENLTTWTVENIKEAINSTKEKAKVKGKMLYMPIRIKVSGQMHGPELPDTIYLLGKETVLKRLSR